MENIDSKALNFAKHIAVSIEIKNCFHFIYGTTRKTSNTTSYGI
jgi:hypothetical protein